MKFRKQTKTLLHWCATGHQRSLILSRQYGKLGYQQSGKIRNCSRRLSTAVVEADLGGNAESTTKEFKDIPSVKSYPLVGSTLTLSNMKTTNRETAGPNVYSTVFQLYQDHSTYRMKIPMIGEFVVETDPYEFTKVLQNEGKHPYSLVCISGSFFKKWVPKLWQLVPFKAIFSRGQEHFEARQFLNKVSYGLIFILIQVKIWFKGTFCT